MLILARKSCDANCSDTPHNVSRDKIDGEMTSGKIDDQEPGGSCTIFDKSKKCCQAGNDCVFPDYCMIQSSIYGSTTQDITTGQGRTRIDGESSPKILSEHCAVADEEVWSFNSFNFWRVAPLELDIDTVYKVSLSSPDFPQIHSTAVKESTQDDVVTTVEQSEIRPLSESLSSVSMDNCYSSTTITSTNG